MNGQPAPNARGHHDERGPATRKNDRDKKYAVVEQIERVEGRATCAHAGSARTMRTRGVASNFATVDR